jgi:glycosyltransferase involved in cell wall biosynthesis
VNGDGVSMPTMVANRTAGVRLKPRILISSFTFPPATNGVSNAAFTHARIMQGLGCQVEVLTFGATASRTEEQGISVSRFPVSGKGHLLSPHRGAVQELQSFLEQNSWDIVFTHCWQAWNTNLLLDFFAKRQRCEKVVLVSHGVSTDSNSHPFPLNLLRRFLWWPYRTFRLPKYLRLLDRLVLLWDHHDQDRFLDSSLAHSMSVPVSVIPNVARYDSASVVPPELKFTAERLSKGLLLCVGNYSEEKNELMVLEAYRLSGMTAVPMVFVGHRLNAYAARLEAYAEQWGLGNVQFCERLSKQEIDWLYTQALLFLCGSKTECQPLVVLDALASGTACISTDVGCVRSLGCVVIAASAKSMAAGIATLLEDAARREGMAENGRELYAQMLSLSSVTGKWDELLTRLMGGCE